MTKYQISRKILALLDCDWDEMPDAIYKLAKEVEEDDEMDAWIDQDWSGLQGGL